MELILFFSSQSGELEKNSIKKLDKTEIKELAANTKPRRYKNGLETEGLFCS